MPILWRHLLTRFLKIFLFSLCVFISILLITRLDDIAHFATLGADSSLILWYILFQIPYIIPITIPLSCLIAATILMQQLSQSHELTAFRSVGFSFINILSPILFISVICSILNFYIISEVATRSHLSSTLLKTELRAINPLLIVHNKHLMRAKGYYFHLFGDSVIGESALQSILAIPNKKNFRMNLLITDELNNTSNHFSGKNMTLITSLPKKIKSGQERLIIENIESAFTQTDDFRKIIDKSVRQINNDHLTLPLLLVRLKEELQMFSNSKHEDHPLKNIYKCLSEFFRRFSVGIAPFSFAFMGAVFGISLSRQKSNKGIYAQAILSFSYLICFFSAKGAEHKPFISALFYFCPHLLIIAISFWVLSRLTKGKCLA